MPSSSKIALLSFVCFVVTSCAAIDYLLSGKWGKIVPDEAAKKSFEAYFIEPDCNYYISGSDVYPTAILVLSKAYILESNLWKKINATPKKLRELVLDMQSKAIDLGQKQFGFTVFDDKGKQIGIWYSLLSAATSVEMKGENRVTIYTPDNDIYDKDERKKMIKKH